MAQTYRNALAALNTADTLVYTCPPGASAVVLGCQVTNKDATARTLNLWWVDSSSGGASAYLARNLSIPVGASYEPISGRLVLEEGDQLRGTGSAAVQLDVTVSVLELS